MKYSINWGELKPTANGKVRFIADLVDEQGNETKSVTIWGDFPDFANIRPGAEVSGKIAEKQNGQYLNRTLYPETTYKTFQAKPSAINTAMKNKEASIERFQGNKEESIKISSTFRDATLITIEILKAGSIDEFGDWKKKWNETREWLWLNYDVSDRDFPPTL